jgi:hypothetical protein
MRAKLKITVMLGVPSAGGGIELCPEVEIIGED